MNRRFAWLAVCMALSVIGSFIKLPTFVGSIALDSAPALVAAAVLGPQAGATVAGLGHFISAYIGGWPLGPFHWLVACEMAVLGALFAAMYGRGWRFGGAIAFLSVTCSWRRCRLSLRSVGRWLSRSFRRCRWPLL